MLMSDDLFDKALEPPEKLGVKAQSKQNPSRQKNTRTPRDAAMPASALVPDEETADDAQAVFCIKQASAAARPGTDADQAETEKARKVAAAAFTRLRQKYETRVKNLIRYWYPYMNWHDAEDCTSLTFINAWKTLNKYEGNTPNYFFGWLIGVARNTTCEMYRSNKKHFGDIRLDNNTGGYTIDLPDTRWNPEAKYLYTHLSEKLEKALDKLTPNQNEIIRLCDIEKVPHQEAADQLGISIRTVRSRLSRARASIRKYLSAPNDP